MFTKKLFSLLLAALVLVGALAAASPVQAAPQVESVCGETWTVRAGDILSRIAKRCGVTVNQIYRANPDLDDVDFLRVGQVIILPGATLPADLNTEFYYIQHGDTLKGIAARFHSSVDELLSLNPQVRERDRIYAGQRLIVPIHDNIPDYVEAPNGITQTHTVQRGDTLQSIAISYGTTGAYLRQLNPQIPADGRLTVGQQITVPVRTNTWTVQPGNTMGGIAVRFGTTVAALMKLNPQIEDPGLIFAGQVIRVR